MIVASMMSRLTLAVALIGVVAAWTVSAPRAQILSSGNVEAELVSDVLEIPAGGTFWIALRQKIRPNWHTYWKNPGDSGEPTRIDWNLPSGFEASDIHWPAPERIPVGPLMNFGYEGEIFLLTEIAAPTALEEGQQVLISAHAEWLVCEEICIPEEADLKISLTATTGDAQADPVWATEIESTLSALPQKAPWPARVAMLNDEVAVSVEAEDLIEAFRSGRIKDVTFFPDVDGIIRNAAPQTMRYGGVGFSVSVEPGYKVANLGGVESFDPVGGVVVIREQKLEQDISEPKTVSFEIEAKVGEIAVGTLTSEAVGVVPQDPPPAVPSVSFIEAIFFALVGGMILNLMPCVFPVLSMKAVGLAKSAKEHPQAVRTGGLAYAAGVILSFILIASLLIALRQAGEQIGWGFQLQSPTFVTLMAYLMFLVGLNLSGVFEVGGSFMGIAGRVTPSSSAAGSFGTGMLAAAVATPCTAPFMGTAMGFALTQTTGSAISVFAALGLGMALPYLAFSFIPGLSSALPRPGPWMDRFKQLLAFPMYATAVWLIWVLSQQMGPSGVLVALSGLVLLGFAGWLFNAIRNVESGWQYAGALIVLLSLFAALAIIRFPSDEQPDLVLAAGTSTEVSLDWEPYSTRRLEELRADGRAVFVNFTAAWCITCLVNEQVVLNGAALAERFRQDNVAYLKGDWTNRDPNITKALARYGRNGVPLYLLYGPAGKGSDTATVLPQILTQAILISALDEVKAIGDETSAAKLDLP